MLDSITSLLLIEFGMFFMSNAADFYLTNDLVKRLGPEAEANQRVRNMYVTGNFSLSWSSIGFVGGLYVLLISIGLYFQIEHQLALFILPIIGIVLPLIAGINLVRGSLIFRKFKARGALERGP